MNSLNKTIFKDQVAQQIWTDYLSQVEHLCGMLNQRQTADIQMELRTHLLESYTQLSSGSEAERIQSAINKLGQPSEFIPLWVEERLLEGAMPGSGTRNLLNLFKMNASKGIKQFVFSMLIGFGYLLAFYFFLAAVLKIFFPEYIGAYLSSSNIPFIGYVDAEGYTELLGYWLIPVGLGVAVSLQMFLNKLLTRKIGRR
jgi:hypothetical protein